VNIQPRSVNKKIAAASRLRLPARVGTKTRKACDRRLAFSDRNSSINISVLASPPDRCEELVDNLAGQCGKMQRPRFLSQNYKLTAGRKRGNRKGLGISET